MKVRNIILVDGPKDGQIIRLSSDACSFNVPVYSWHTSEMSQLSDRDVVDEDFSADIFTYRLVFKNGMWFGIPESYENSFDILEHLALFYVKHTEKMNDLQKLPRYRKVRSWESRNTMP